MERMIPLPPGLLEQQENLPVPAKGNNEDLLSWMMQCASNNRKMNLQLKALQDLDSQP
jgi:hypothetical protein